MIVSRPHARDGISNSFKLTDITRNATGYEIRRLERRSFRCPQRHLELGLIIIGQEILVHSFAHRDDRQEGRNRQQNDHPPIAKTLFQKPDIAILDERIEPPLFGNRFSFHWRRPIFGNVGSEPLFGPRSAQQPGSQRGSQRKAHEQAHHDRKAHCHAERAHETTNNAGHEGNRRKRGNKRQCDRQDGEPDFASPVAGCFEGIFAKLLHASEDVFNHDDGIIHHDSHAQCKREECDHVKRVAFEPEKPKRGDDRSGNCESGNKRRPRIREEEVHNYGREKSSKDQVFLNGFRRGANEQ